MVSRCNGRTCRCIEHSSSPEKLALNLLEFLVSSEDCQDLTVYGQGETKQSMAPNMRRAIKSKISHSVVYLFGYV